GIHIAGSLSEWNAGVFCKRFSPLAIEAARALSQWNPHQWASYIKDNHDGKRVPGPGWPGPGGPAPEKGGVVAGTDGACGRLVAYARRGAQCHSLREVRRCTAMGPAVAASRAVPGYSFLAQGLQPGVRALAHEPGVESVHRHVVHFRRHPDATLRGRGADSLCADVGARV